LNATKDMLQAQETIFDSEAFKRPYPVSIGEGNWREVYSIMRDPYRTI
jgi:hypothetical protein